VNSYRISAQLDIAVSQHDRRLADVNASRRALAGVLQDAFNHLILNDADLRERLWRAAGGGDDIDGTMQFSVSDVQPS
jgi:hypothetical protein